MTNYFVYCENHGRLEGNYSDPNKASIKRREHVLNDPGPHGKVSVIEEYKIRKYGQELTALRKFKG